MGQSFSFIDIIILALVTFFLVQRLRSVLGRRTGTEKPPDSENVVPMPRRTTAVKDEAGRVDDEATGVDANAQDLGGPTAGEIDPTASQGISEIKRADPTFEEDRFLSGARVAFETILKAYAQGDVETLRDLLSESVYEPFSSAIADRQSRGETMDSELVSMKSVTLIGARMEGRMAQVSVRFVSEQIILTRDQAGTVVDGDPSRLDVVIDDWTFQRDVASRNPNWLLAVTTTPQT